jgi:LPS-assembly lipoprotein
VSTPPAQSWFKSAAILGAAALLAGCGLHLAGERPVPPALSSIYVDMVQPYRVGTPPLETALQSRLTSRGADVKSHEGDAKSILRLSNLSETRETLSVGADGKANEYRLVTQVTYEVISNGAAVVQPQVQGISRTYSFSIDEILAKETEESRLRNYMQDELAALILLRIDAELARQPPSSPAGTPAAGPSAPPASAPADPDPASPAG